MVSKEHMIVCDTTQKPLILLYLMHTAPYHIANALVFTKSADSTARLVKLIHAFEESYQQSFSTSTSELVREENSAPSRPYIAAESYSSDLTGSQRKSILERFKNGKITM
jgi:ATP-dependent RNA helicase DDX51/DBP6